MAGVDMEKGLEDIAKSVGALYWYVEDNPEACRLLNKIERANVEAQCQFDELGEFAVVDSLTGLYNRRFFDDALEREVALVNRDVNYKSSVALFDVDYFKGLNDGCGHLAGDYVLREIGAMMREGRREDFSCRYGGDELALIFPDVGRDGAFRASEKLRKRIEDREWVYDGKILGGVSISGGFSEIMEGDSPERIIKRIDHDLYLAKENGRNRIWAG